MTQTPYQAVTRDIRISVEPFYLREKSDPERGYHFWAYTVAIENLGTETVHLRSRYWRIIDATGHVEEVRGAGVVGEQPVIAPGERFDYTSGCPLRTSSGMMIGSYHLEVAGGEAFDAVVPTFSLDVPDDVRKVN